MSILLISLLLILDINNIINISLINSINIREIYTNVYSLILYGISIIAILKLCLKANLLFNLIYYK